MTWGQFNDHFPQIKAQWIETIKKPNSDFSDFRGDCFTLHGCIFINIFIPTPRPFWNILIFYIMHLFHTVKLLFLCF